MTPGNTIEAIGAAIDAVTHFHALIRGDLAQGTHHVALDSSRDDGEDLHIVLLDRFGEVVAVPEDAEPGESATPQLRVVVDVAHGDVAGLGVTPHGLHDADAERPRTEDQNALCLIARPESPAVIAALDESAGKHPDDGKEGGHDGN